MGLLLREEPAQGLLLQLLELRLPILFRRRRLRLVCPGRQNPVHHDALDLLDEGLRASPRRGHHVLDRAVADVVRGQGINLLGSAAGSSLLLKLSFFLLILLVLLNGLVVLIEGGFTDPDDLVPS